jgi:hypothetical protein
LVVVIIIIILVMIFYVKDKNNSRNDDASDVYMVNQGAGDDIDVHIIQTPKLEDKKKKQIESNEDPYANPIIEMQDLSPTINDQ